MSKKLKLFLCASFIILAWTLAQATSPERKPGMRHISEDVPIDAPGNEKYLTPSRIPFRQLTPGIAYPTNCTDINPQAGTIIRHDQIGSTWYDFQQNGSMGRMIAVTPGGYREDSWMYTAGVYPLVGRYIQANQKPPAGEWFGYINADGGTGINSGYSNQSYLDGPGADSGASVLIFHRTAGTPTWYTTLCVDDVAGGNSFTRKFDVPDSITGSTYHSEWPRVEVKYDASAGKDYIHIVGTEGQSAGGVPAMVTYVRCYIKDGPGPWDTLVCQTYDGYPKTYKVVAGTSGNPLSTISYFDSSCSITPVVVVSRFSRRVAVAWLRPSNCDLSTNHCDFGSDVCFIESMNSGEDWVNGAIWPPPEYNTTNYGCGGTERGYSDLNACYDYQDSLHIVYVTAGFDSTAPAYYQPGIARLYHWSKKDGKSRIASKIQGGTNPGQHNANIAKMSISAQDPVYHPAGDSVYLYCIWTQFDSADQSAAGYSNGDLFGCGSKTGGASWGNVYNLTHTRTPNCTPGNCLSEHWSSLAQNMYNGNLHIQYVCDKDAGGAIQDSPSQWMDNPVMYLELQAWSLQFQHLDDGIAIIAYSPVNLIVTDPNSDSISLWFNTIPGAYYDTTQDYDHDGEKDDIISIPNVLVGNYQIRVVAEPGGSGTYDLGIRIDGGAPAMLVTGQPCPGPGEADTFHYDVPPYKAGDANGDWNVDIGDIVYLINYLYKGGVSPDPLGSGDATCDNLVDVGDVIYLINYLFKSWPAPAC